jgi:hypothetical protein
LLVGESRESRGATAVEKRQGKEGIRTLDIQQISSTHGRGGVNKMKDQLINQFMGYQSRSGNAVRNQTHPSDLTSHQKYQVATCIMWKPE